MINDARLLFHLMNEAPAGIAVVREPGHVFELVNPRYATLVGRPVEELLGKRLQDLFPELANQGWVSVLDQVLASGEKFVGNEVELTFTDPASESGRVVYVDVVCQPMPDQGSGSAAIFIHAADVTQQVLARHEVERLARDLRLQSDHLRQVLDVLPLGIAIGDASGAIIQSNAEARRIWGQDAVAGGVEEYVEYGLWSIDGEVLEPTEIAYSRSLLNGEVIHNEQMLVGNKAEGTRIPLLQNSAPLRGEDGEITGAVIAFADITHMKELERQKDDFLSLVSHELRTPLTTIAGNAKSLAQYGNALSQEAIDAAHRDIQADAVRLQQVIENMLALSTVDSQRGAELEPVLLERVVATAVADHQRRFPNREVHFVPGGGNCVVDGMPSFVLQLTNNLLSNAEKYGPQSGPIDVTVCREGDMAVTRVLDRGEGVAASETELVFEAFFRANTTARRAAGLGLGLAVCKRLIDAQGGRIWYRPREGGGSEFGFSLNLCPE